MYLRYTTPYYLEVPGRLCSLLKCGTRSGGSHVSNLLAYLFLERWTPPRRVLVDNAKGAESEFPGSTVSRVGEFWQGAGLIEGTGKYSSVSVEGGLVRQINTASHTRLTSDSRSVTFGLAFGVACVIDMEDKLLNRRARRGIYALGQFLVCTAMGNSGSLTRTSDHDQWALFALVCFSTATVTWTWLRTRLSRKFFLGSCDPSGWICDQ